MSCVPHVMYGLVVVVNFAIALLRICMTKSKLDVEIKLAINKNKIYMSDIVAMPRESALPLPLRPRTSGHAALAGAVSACSSDCALLAWEI